MNFVYVVVCVIREGYRVWVVGILELVEGKFVRRFRGSYFFIF